MKNMPKQSDDLSRKDEPSQKTEKGLQIPVPEKGEFEDFLEGVKQTANKPGNLSTRKPKPNDPKA